MDICTNVLLHNLSRLSCVHQYQDSEIVPRHEQITVLWNRVTGKFLLYAHCFLMRGKGYIVQNGMSM
jgi:hypothetical protein